MEPDLRVKVRQPAEEEDAAEIKLKILKTNLTKTRNQIMVLASDGDHEAEIVIGAKAADTGAMAQVSEENKSFSI